MLSDMLQEKENQRVRERQIFRIAVERIAFQKLLMQKIFHSIQHVVNIRKMRIKRGPVDSGSFTYLFDCYFLKFCVLHQLQHGGIHANLRFPVALIIFRIHGVSSFLLFQHKSVY